MYVSASMYPISIYESMYTVSMYLYMYLCTVCIYVSVIYLSIIFICSHVSIKKDKLSVYLKCYRNATCSRWRWERQQNLLFHKLTHLSSSFFHLVFIFSFNSCRDGRPWATIMLNIVAPRGPGKTHPPANNAAEVKHSAAWMEEHFSCTADLAWRARGSPDRKHTNFSFFGGEGNENGMKSERHRTPSR